jgi:hypothetical protein
MAQRKKKAATEGQTTAVAEFKAIKKSAEPKARRAGAKVKNTTKAAGAKVVKVAGNTARVVGAALITAATVVGAVALVGAAKGAGNLQGFWRGLKS